MKQISLRKEQSGFTIVELLITIIVGTIIIGAVHTILLSQLHLSEREKDIVLVNAFIENKVESLRSIGFAGLSDGTTTITSELPSELKTPRSGTVVISSQSSAIKKAVVSVTYNDQGNAQTYSYTTYIGELGVGQY